MEKKFVMAYSCGKDSTLALYKMIEMGYKPACLLITTKDGEASWFHHITKELVDKVSKSLGIEVIFQICPIEDYEGAFVEGLKKAKEEYGCSLCAFGDIDIEKHKKWDLDMCEKAGLEGILPLWQMDRRSLTFEFIDRGFKGIVKKADLKILNESFLGEILTRELAEKIEETGADMCGENGEYHTFVYDGPIFKEPINFTIIEKDISTGYGHLKIQ